MTPALLKKLGGALVFLVALWVAYAYQQVPHNQTPFLKASSQASRIVIEQGPKKIELRKQSGGWTIGAGPGPFYAAEERLTGELLSGLTNLQIADQLTDREDRAAEYEVNPESGTRVTLFDAKEKKLADGLFGKQTPDRSHLYFRYPDKPNVYLSAGVNPSNLGRPEASFWRSRKLIDIPENKIQGILIEGKGFRTDLIRISTDSWTLNGSPVDSAPVNILVGTLAHLQADDFVDSALNPGFSYAGLDYARIQVKSQEASVDIRFGSQDPLTKHYLVSVGKDQGLAWLSENTAQSLLKKPSAFPAAQGPGH